MFLLSKADYPVLEKGRNSCGPTHHSTGRCAMKPRTAGEFKRWAS
jgi:hypothetical protein